MTKIKLLIEQTPRQTAESALNQLVSIGGHTAIKELPQVNGVLDEELVSAIHDTVRFQQDVQAVLEIMKKEKPTKKDLIEALCYNSDMIKVASLYRKYEAAFKAYIGQINKLTDDLRSHLT